MNQKNHDPKPHLEDNMSEQLWLFWLCTSGPCPQLPLRRRARVQLRAALPAPPQRERRAFNHSAAPAEYSGTGTLAWAHTAPFALLQHGSAGGRRALAPRSWPQQRSGSEEAQRRDEHGH